MINNRQAGRRRGRGGQRPQGGNPNRGPDNGNRIDSRARGNAAQLHEKYKTLARDAQMQGDRVMSEYYWQFADHYFRVLSESRSRFEENRRQRDDYADGEDDDADGNGLDDDFGGRPERDTRDGRDFRDNREFRDGRESRDGREQRDGREPRESRDGREPRDSREGREPREGRDNRESRADREPREGRGSFRDDRDARPRREPRIARQPVAREPEQEVIATVAPAVEASPDLPLEPVVPVAVEEEASKPARRARQPRARKVEAAEDTGIDATVLPPALSPVSEEPTLPLNGVAEEAAAEPVKRRRGRPRKSETATPAA